MKLVTELFQHSIEIPENGVASLVIENGLVFRSFIEELNNAVEYGDDDLRVLEGLERKKASQTLELLSSFVPFSLNSKTLLAALVKKLDKLGQAAGRIDRTRAAIESLERYLRELTFELPHEIEMTGLALSSILKAAGLAFAEDDLSPSERLLQYMRLVREFEGERIFVLVNARGYYLDSELESILHIAGLEKLRMLFVDSQSRRLLSGERRLTIDEDLCEFTPQDDEI